MRAIIACAAYCRGWGDSGRVVGDVALHATSVGMTRFFITVLLQPFLISDGHDRWVDFGKNTESAGAWISRLSAFLEVGICSRDPKVDSFPPDQAAGVFAR